MTETSSGDRFAAVMTEVVEPVRRYLARRVDPATADDVLSETTIVLWRRLAEVPAGDEVPWAIGVARRQLQNALRSRRRQDRLLARIMTVDPPSETAEEADPGDPRVQLVRGVLAEMRASDAEILRLHAWEELAVVEIARVLEISPNAASIRLHRARRTFAARLAGRGSTGATAITEGGGR